MNPYETMRQLDVEAGIPPRSDPDLLADVPGSLTNRCFSGDWEDFLAGLEIGDVAVIAEARQMWGLPVLV